MTQSIPPVTPDEHLATLTEFASLLERSAAWLNRNHSTALGELHAKRAESLRWLLALNAYGVDEHEVTI